MEKGRKISLVPFMLVAAVLISSVSHAQMICKISYASLMTCKPSVTPPKPSAPSAACCTALSNADLGCLCSYRNSKLLPSLGIDPNLAMQLPDKCHLPQPPTC